MMTAGANFMLRNRPSIMFIGLWEKKSLRMLGLRNNISFGVFYKVDGLSAEMMR